MHQRDQSAMQHKTPAGLSRNSTLIFAAASRILLPLLFQLGFGLSVAETGALILIYFLGNLTAKTINSRTRLPLFTVVLVDGAHVAIRLTPKWGCNGKNRPEGRCTSSHPAPARSRA